MHKAFMHLWSTSALIMAGTVAMPAAVFAQEEAQPQASSSGFGEIIVTAQRREEKLQDVPIAITAMSADSLRAPFHAREIALADVIPMMINQPERLGVLLCPPYAGAILAPAAGALCGAPGINYDIYLGGECPLCAPLEQNDNALRDQLNPFGLLRAIEHLLREGMHLEREAACIEASMRNVLQAGWRTGDIALPDTPPLQMNGITELICEQIEVAGEWITHE